MKMNNVTVAMDCRNQGRRQEQTEAVDVSHLAVGSDLVWCCEQPRGTHDRDCCERFSLKGPRCKLPQSSALYSPMLASLDWRLAVVKGRLQRVQIACGRSGRIAQGIFIRRHQGDADAATDHVPLLRAGVVRRSEMDWRADAARPGPREAEARDAVRFVQLVCRRR